MLFEWLSRMRLGSDSPGCGSSCEGMALNSFKRISVQVRSVSNDVASRLLLSLIVAGPAAYGRHCARNLAGCAGPDRMLSMNGELNAMVAKHR